MNNFFRNILLILAVIANVNLGFAQDEKEEQKAKNDTLKTESVVVIKTFNPTINDAFKINAEPSFENASPSVKPNLKYDINSVPVASTFVPEKTKSIEVKKEKPISQFSNYAKLGVGNYLNINAEVFSTLEIDRYSNFSVLLEHLSSQGGIRDIVLDDKFYDTGLQLSYNKNSKRIDWSTDLEFQHQLYNWYGVDEDQTLLTAEELENLEVSHNFIDVNLGTQLIFRNNVFQNVSARFRHFRDDFGSSENNLVIDPEFHLNLDEMNFQLPVTIDFLTGSFEESAFLEQNKYTYLNAGVSPSLVVNFQGVNVKIGFSGFISIDSENSETNFYAYPNIAANYEIPAYNVSLFGGVKGKLIQNTYHNAANENKYAAPLLLIAPTSQAFNVFAGAKGSLSNLGYEAQLSFARDKDLPLWTKLQEIPFANEPSEYGVANSFIYTYDNLSTTKLDLKLNYDVENSYGLQIKGTFAAYSPKDQEEAWNLPSIQGNLQAHYFVTPKIKTSAGFYFMGSRKDINPIDGVTVETVDGFFDPNLRIDYKINKQLQAFLLGNNLASTNYEQWLGYPVQSVNFLIGAKYKF